MTAALIALLLVPAQAVEAGGTAVERTVRRTSLDALGRKQEIHRKELVLVRGPSVAVVDLTFGERLIIRPDLKKIWKLDPLAKEYSELTFEQAAAIRKAALDEIRAAKARVPGTKDEEELAGILEGFDQFGQPPSVELQSQDAQRKILVNGDRVRLSVQVNPQVQAPGWLDALAAIGAFHPAVAEKLGLLGGLPVKGTMRYVLFLERIVEEFEVTSAGAREIGDAEFEVPKGLRKVPLRGFEPVPDRKPAKPANFQRDFKEDDRDKPKPETTEGEKKDKP